MATTDDGMVSTKLSARCDASGVQDSDAGSGNHFRERVRKKVRHNPSSRSACTEEVALEMLSIARPTTNVDVMAMAHCGHESDITLYRSRAFEPIGRGVTVSTGGTATDNVLTVGLEYPLTDATLSDVVEDPLFYRTMAFEPIDRF